MTVRVFRAGADNEYGDSPPVALKIERQAAERLLAVRDAMSDVLRLDNFAAVEVSDYTPTVMRDSELYDAVGDVFCDDEIEMEDEEIAHVPLAACDWVHARLDMRDVYWEFRMKHNPHRNFTPCVSWREIVEASGQGGRCKRCGGRTEKTALFSSVVETCGQEGCQANEE